MNRKIEKGCLALVVGGELANPKPNTGKIVRVGNFLGKLPSQVCKSADNDIWEVDKPIVWGNKQGHRIIFKCASEKYLQRIDDDIPEDELNADDLIHDTV
jgi:hypothetical protein